MPNILIIFVKSGAASLTTNDVLYQLSYTGPVRRRYSIGAGAGEGEICAAGAGARAPAARVQALSTPRLIR